MNARPPANRKSTANEIASQLRGIKRALMFGAACLFVQAVSNIYFMADDVREDTERHLGYTFYDQADALAKEQEWDDLLKLALARQAKRPRDPNAFLFAGMAYLNKDNLDQAEPAFRHMAELNKGWKKSADAWLKAVAEKRKAARPQPTARG